MLARNCCVPGLLVAEKVASGKGRQRRSEQILCRLAVATTLVLSVAMAPGSVAQEQPASAQEVQQLRKDVNDLRETVKRLEALLESRSAPPPAQPPAASNPTAVLPPPAGAATAAARP